jgi:hypothetical protein
MIWISKSKNPKIQNPKIQKSKNPKIQKSKNPKSKNLKMSTIPSACTLRVYPPRVTTLRV